MNGKMRYWRIVPLASVITDYGKIPLIPSDQKYHALINERYFKSREDAQKIADFLTRKFDLNHSVISVSDADEKEGRLCKYDPTIYCAEDLIVVFANYDEDRKKWEIASEGDNVSIRVMFNGSEYVPDKCKWFVSGTLTMKDITVNHISNEGCFIISGTKSEQDQFGSFLDL